MEVSPEGWISPLFVQYGVDEDENLFGIPTYFWRVKGTEHTFTIPIIRIDFLSSGNYKEHFNEALEIFREDYIKWKDEGFVTEWSRQYRKQFSRFIII